VTGSEKEIDREEEGEEGRNGILGLQTIKGGAPSAFGTCSSHLKKVRARWSGKKKFSKGGEFRGSILLELAFMGKATSER